MSYDYLVAGTVRITDQSYIVPTSTAIKIYEVFLVTSGSNQCISFTDNAPTTTATSTTTQKLHVVASTSSTGYFIGQYSNAMGLRFNNSALLHTCSAFHYAVVTYVAEK